MLTNEPQEGGGNPPQDPPKNDPPQDPPKNDPPKNDPPADPPPKAALDWDTVKQNLPEDLVKDSAMSTITSLEGLAKSYVHAQKSIGKDKIPVPDKHATEEDYKEVFRKLGVPEKLDDYKVNVEGEINEDVFNTIKETAHKSGILPWQLEKVVGAFNEKVGELSQQHTSNIEAQQKEQLDALKNEWGKAFDEKVNQANAAFKHLIPDAEERDKALESGLGNNPLVVKMLAKAAEMMSEDDFIGQGDGKLAGLTPDEALQKAREIQGNPDHPYRNPAHPNHKKAKEEVANYYKIAFPE